MTKEEGVSMLEGNISYSVWTPYDAFEAAETLLDALKADNVTSAHHGDTERTEERRSICVYSVPSS